MIDMYDASPASGGVTSDRPTVMPASIQPVGSCSTATTVAADGIPVVKVAAYD